MRGSFTILAFIVLASTAFSARADAVRCDGRIVVVGDTRAQLRDVCGDPEDVQTQRILQQPSYFVDGRQYFVGTQLVEILVEYWTYNFGPQKLMRRIRIEDGVITDMETLGYGHN